MPVSFNLPSPDYKVPDAPTGEELSDKAAKASGVWQAARLGDVNSPELKFLFAAAKEGLKIHEQNAQMVNALYKTNKTLLFATIDPFFAALEALIDQIIDLIRDLRNLGFYSISITSQSVEPTAIKNPVTGAIAYNGEYWTPAYTDDEGNLTSNEELGSLAKDGEGNQLYVKHPSMANMLTDEYSGVSGEPQIWFNDQLGLLNLTPAGITGEIGKAINDPFEENRPVFSNSASCGGILFLAGAPDFLNFREAIKAFTAFFELDSFNKLKDDLEKIWDPLEPLEETIKVKGVAQRYYGDEIGAPTLREGGFSVGPCLLYTSPSPRD